MRLSFQFFERKTRLESTLRLGYSANLYLHPRPLKGANRGRSVGASFPRKSKRTALRLSFQFSERKTRLEPTLRLVYFANLSVFTPPSPERGESGSLGRSLVFLKIEKDSLATVLSISVSGKRDSNSRPQPWQGCALPTELFPHYFTLQLRDIRPDCECKDIPNFSVSKFFGHNFYAYKTGIGLSG